MNHDQVLQNALKSMNTYYTELLDYYKSNAKFDPAGEITEDLDDTVFILKDLVPELTTYLSLENLDEDEFCFIFDVLVECSENFIIDESSPEKEKQEEEYELLEEILDAMQANLPEEE